MHPRNDIYIHVRASCVYEKELCGEEDGKAELQTLVMAMSCTNIGSGTSMGTSSFTRPPSSSTKKCRNGFFLPQIAPKPRSSPAWGPFTLKPGMQGPGSARAPAETGTCGWVFLRVGGEGRAQGAAKGQALQRLDMRVAMHADLLAPQESWMCQRGVRWPMQRQALGAVRSFRQQLQGRMPAASTLTGDCKSHSDAGPFQNQP